MIKRYTRPEIGAVWTDENKYKCWLKVETAVLQARADSGEIPAGVPDEVRRDAAFSVERIEEIEAETRHDVIAFITNIGEHIGKNSQYFHQGLTSSDVLDTALALQIQEASKIISQGIENLLSVLAVQAKKYKNTPIAGRTHGVHAEPTTFGLKLAGFYAELSRDYERFKTAVEDIRFGKISGAVGTYSLLNPSIEAKVMESLDLMPDPVSTQIVQRDRHAYYMATLAVIGGTLERLALEIRHLSRTELTEALEPFGKKQRGSSAMPHKKNPVICENICGCARLIRANSMAAMENQALWHERDISHSSVERIILPDSTILLDYMLDRAAFVVKDMTVYPENMLKNLQISGGLIYSQSVLNLILNKGFDRDTAYRMVQKCAMKSRDEGLPFEEVLKKDEEIMEIASESEISKCFTKAVEYVDTVFSKLGLT